MNFKEMLQDDLDIFINPEEFGEKVMLGDKEYVAVLTYSSEETIPIYEGMVKSVDLTVSLKHDTELFEEHTEGTSLPVNGVQYIVNKVHSVEGILTFYLLKTQAR